MENFLTQLNDKQQAAATQLMGRIRIVAGAGSGKTKVLTHRFAFLVNVVGIDPSGILCLTFTNKAAQEMRNRIGTMVEPGKIGDFVCTIHAFCVKFLRQEIYRIGYPKNFKIVDEPDMKDLAQQVMEARGIKRSASTVRQLLSAVSLYKSQTEYVKNLIEPTTDGEQEISTEEAVIKLQQKQFVLDFQDLIFFTIYILENFQEARDYWQTKIAFTMVDEVQDCNKNDWAIIEHLTAKSNNLFIVGDPDQAIYEWRGAEVDTFVNFQSDKDIVLDQNYRSTPNILDVANSIIAHNKNRIPKDLFTTKTSSNKPIHFHAATEKKEANWIAKQIIQLVKEGRGFGEMAILYRSSFMSRSIEQALLRKNIKYTVWGGVRFFEREEIRHALAYLRLIADTGDNTALRRIINVPSRKFGKASEKRLMQMSAMSGRPMFECLKADSTFMAKPALRDFVVQISEIKSQARHQKIADTLDQVLKATSLMEMYRSSEDEERLENIQELIHSIQQYEKDNEHEDVADPLSQYLQDIALYTNADYKKDGQTVKLMTIHQSKGLEFPFVFVCGLNEGTFPSYRAIRERKGKAEEEERRLMYVAVTRAEEGLYLTESEGYNYNTSSDKYPSRYFMEVPEGMLDLQGKISKDMWDGTRKLARDLSVEIGEITEESAETPFAVGTRVRSQFLGEGTIVEAPDANNVCHVLFTNGNITIPVSADKLEVV